MQFSVLIPNYDFAHFLPAAVESVLGQTFADLELVLVDDCSTDGSWDVMERYARQDRRVRCIRHDRNHGISRAFNTCIESARGRFIAFFASDDVWLPEKLERQNEILARREDAVVWSDPELIDSHGERLGIPASRVLAPEPRQTDGRLLDSLAQGNYIVLSTVAARSEHVKRFGFDERFRYFSDYWLFLELAREHEYVFQQPSFTLYRRHDDNASANKDKQAWLADARLLKRLFEQEMQQHLSPDACADFQRYIRRFIYWMETYSVEGARKEA